MGEPTDLFDDLTARGLIEHSTDLDALAARLREGPLSVYYGCDPTAESLHVGNLIGLCVLRRFQEAGHRPIALAGGATGMIGDPSGKSDERNLLTDEVLSSNVAQIRGRWLASSTSTIRRPLRSWSTTAVGPSRSAFSTSFATLGNTSRFSR